MEAVKSNEDTYSAQGCTFARSNQVIIHKEWLIKNSLTIEHIIYDNYAQEWKKTCELWNLALPTSLEPLAQYDFNGYTVSIISYLALICLHPPSSSLERWKDRIRKKMW